MMFSLLYTFCLHFYLVNKHVFDYPDSRLFGLFTEVPTSPDIRGSTVSLFYKWKEKSCLNDFEYADLSMYSSVNRLQVGGIHLHSCFSCGLIIFVKQKCNLFVYRNFNI